MKRIFILLYSILFILNVGYTQSSRPAGTLSNLHPSKEAKAVYNFLMDMKGKKILSGQQDSPWGIDEFEYLRENTGKQPAIKGMDFIHERDNAGEVQKAIDWWKAGGIPTIMWHWGAPSIGEGYEPSKKPIDIDNCFVEGTPENIAFWAELKAKGDWLQQLKEANIPIIWRPFHELNGHWFWWGKQGPEKFKKLWITMYNYYVNERGLNNLIWTLCYMDNPDQDWYPGDQYVDIAGADTYAKDDNPQLKMYNKVKTISNNQFPIAFHECGILPDPDKCLNEGAMWSWWMEWHTGHLTKLDKTSLKMVYGHELIITLDEMPDVMEKYGK